MDRSNYCSTAAGSAPSRKRAWKLIWEVRVNRLLTGSNHQLDEKERIMNKGLADAFSVIDLWIRAIFGAIESTVFLPFNFIAALFN